MFGIRSAAFFRIGVWMPPGSLAGSSLRGIAWIVVAAAGASGRGEQPAGRDVERLLRDLNAPSAAARDAADAAILDLGPAILPRVVAARERAAGEAALRLHWIQQRLEEAAADEAVEAASGTLRFSVVRVEPVAGGASVRLLMRASWGGECEPLVIRLPMRSIVADGPAGEAMLPTHRMAVVEPSLPPGATAVDLPLVLAQPEHRLDTLATVRGTLVLWLAGREQAFEIPLDGSGPRIERSGGAIVTLDDLTERQGVVRVVASVAYDGSSEALASHRPWLARYPLDVVDSRGNPRPRRSTAMIGRSDRGATVEASFSVVDERPQGAEGSPQPTGLRLRWRLPVAIHEVRHDFMVRDVRLPVPATVSSGP
jgi:hypothetical protein